MQALISAIWRFLNSSRPTDGPAQRLQDLKYFCISFALFYFLN